MSTDSKQQAEEKPQWLQKKEEGNAAYRNGEVDSAIDLYTQALNLAETQADAKDRGLLLCNRAQCFIKKEEYESTVEDCTTCLTLSKNNVKALFRRLERTTLALCTLLMYCNIRPNLIFAERRHLKS
jgi:tetratricopeptide (TPR) repeat protein